MTVRGPFAICFVILFAACTQHEEREITPWMKVDVARPKGGDSGVITTGSKYENFSAKIGGRWVRLGTGHMSAYMLLADGQAVLFDLHDNKGVQLAREGSLPRRIPQEFGAAGEVTVTPDADSIDVLNCRVPAEPAGCREGDIERYDAGGTRLAAFPFAMPASYSDCQILSIIGYDKDGAPFLASQCKMNSTQAKCVLVGARKDAPFVYAVTPDRPWSECNDYPRSGVSLAKPMNYTVIQ